MATAIRVENVSKQYRLGQIGTGALTHDVNRWWHKVRGKEDPYLKIGESNDRTLKANSEYVWSLRDISFAIEQGDSVGIIGRNGAGKSTLLKILSRVTAPTTGSVKVKGRIASLLEVGTGFHPELSGRDNIFLNGAILGMRKHEIKRKFDEIVAFAGVDKYIDTPVKRYSSGMYVRLAFAVAAHLESEILIVDEVLAVGDAEFQQKCLGKMGQVSKGEGRTVLFVSHQMGSVAQLCNNSILLQHGNLKLHDKTPKVIDQYINQRTSHIGTSYAVDAEPNQDIFVRRAFVANEQGKEEGTFRHDHPITIHVEGFVRNWIQGSELRIIVRDHRHLNVFTADIELDQLARKSGGFSASFSIPQNLLRPTHYSVAIAIHVLHQYHIELNEEALSFLVYDGGTKYAQSEGTDYGMIFSPCVTELKETPTVISMNGL